MKKVQLTVLLFILASLIAVLTSLAISWLLNRYYIKVDAVNTFLWIWLIFIGIPFLWNVSSVLLGMTIDDTKTSVTGYYLEGGNTEKRSVPFTAFGKTVDLMLTSVTTPHLEKDNQQKIKLETEVFPHKEVNLPVCIEIKNFKVEKTETEAHVITTQELRSFLIGCWRRQYGEDAVANNYPFSVDYWLRVRKIGKKNFYGSRFLCEKYGIKIGHKIVLPPEKALLKIVNDLKNET